MTQKDFIGLAVAVAVGLIVAFLPAPEGITRVGMMYVGVFVAVVVGLILEPAPPAFIGILGVVTVSVFRLQEKAGPTGELLRKSPKEVIGWALSGFSNTTVWLIFIAFMFALGYQKSGLGKRISLLLTMLLGKSTLGLGYAVAFADGILAPLIPSNTARSGGTIFPIVKNIPEMFESYPEKNPRKIGSYLMWVCLATTCVTSSLFLTGLAPNLLAVSLVEKNTGIILEWGTWFKAMAPVGIGLFLLVPVLTYFIYPPVQKSSPEAPVWAKGELKKMGAFTIKEMLMAGFGILALLLWIFGKKVGIHGTTTALIVLSLMLLAGIITWDDVLGNKRAWNVLVWFATLVALAGGLADTGLTTWVAKLGAKLVGDSSVLLIMITLVVLFFYLHYFFASVTAHVTALLPLFLSVGAGIEGMPMQAYALVLCGSLGIMGILTPYGTGPSPIYFGSGYISRQAFWGLGAAFGLLFLGVYTLGGIPWILKVL